MAFQKGYQGRLCAALLSTMKESRFCDVTFLVGKDEKRFDANRMLLAAASDVFNAMFYGNMRESRTD